MKIILTFIQKSLLSIATCLLCTVSVFAANTVSVTSGKSAALKVSSKALFEVDYSATTIEDLPLDEYLQKRGEDYVKNWAKDTDYAAKYFIDRFNKKNKGLKIVSNQSEASYKIVIHVNILDMGNSASMFIPFASAKAGGIIMTGTVDIVDIKSNEVVCSLAADQVKGGAHVSATVRMGLMFMELATKMCAIK